MNGATAAAFVIRSRQQNGELQGLAGLRSCREYRHMSTNELARRTGLTKDSLRAWEAGRYWPSALHLPALAGALGCTIEELYLGREEDRDP